MRMRKKVNICFVSQKHSKVNCISIVQKRQSDPKEDLNKNHEYTFKFGMKWKYVLHIWEVILKS